MGKLTNIATLTAVVGVAIAAAAYKDNHDRESAKSEVKRVVTVLDGSLVDAANGRKEMLKLNVRVNHCRIWPADAAAKVGLFVEANRAHVARDTAGIGSATNRMPCPLCETSS